MVAVSPFRAFRYSLEAVSDLSLVVAPPYDIIDEAEQERLHQASPFNIVRLILGKRCAGDTAEENPYTRARQNLRAWRECGVLRQDERPGFYVVSHGFEDEGGRRSRLGFIGLLGLDEDSRRLVHRHEATLQAPKEDRARLLDAVGANLSPIFCVYRDEEETLQALLDGVAQRSEPLATARMGREEVRVWALTEPGPIEQVMDRMASSAVLIADGHHRFEVACAKRDRYPVMMSYFVSMVDASLVVRPIHRVVRCAAASREGLRELCRMERVAELATLHRWLQEPSGEARFGYFDGQALYQIGIDPERLSAWLAAPPIPQPVAALDVSLLHGLLLPAIQGDGSLQLSYTADAAQAIQEAKADSSCSAWLLRGIPLEQVFSLASQRVTLPPKSTYFYPKVPSGLAIHLLA